MTRHFKSAAGVWLLMIAPSLAAAGVRTVAISGQTAPGSGVLGAPQPFYDFGVPSLNTAGRVAFHALLPDGLGIDQNIWGVWSETDSGLDAVALQSTPALGQDQSYGRVFDAVVTDAGTVGFTGWTEAGPERVAAFAQFQYRPTGVEIVAKEGDPAPGGGRFSSVGWASNNSIGGVAFSSPLAPEVPQTRSTWGIWSNVSGTVTSVAREGGAAPGTDGVFRNYEHSGPTFVPLLNDHGSVAFYGTVDLPGPSQYSDGVPEQRGIWTNRRGTLELAFADPSLHRVAPGFDSAGHLVFATGSHNEGTVLYSDRTGSVTRVLQWGDQLPGMAANERLRDVVNRPLMNAQGRIGIVARYGTSSAGLWLEDGLAQFLPYSNNPPDTTLPPDPPPGRAENFRLIARDGDSAPGLPSGVKLVGFEVVPYLGLSLNAVGQVAFMTTLNVRADYGDDYPARGIFATDRNGVLRLIAAETAPLELAPGDSRIVSSLAFIGLTGGDDGWPAAFNDAGQIAFVATFTDGTGGVFVSDVATVPEPSSALVLAMAVALERIARRIKSARRNGR